MLLNPYRMFGKKVTKKEIAEGMLQHRQEIYDYIDAKLRKKVIAHVLKNSGTAEDGEELFQDVVYELYVNIRDDKFDIKNEGTFEGYFMTIVRRRWIDRLRKRHQNVTTDAIDINDSDKYLNTGVGDDTEEVYSERARAVKKHRADLSEDDKKLISLHYDEGLTLRDIAKNHLYIEEGTIRTRHNRVKRKLLSMIQADSEFDSLLFSE